MGIAKDKAFSAYLEGTHDWAAVRVLDACVLFRLALERGKAGSIYHAAGDQSVAFKDIAQAIGKGLGLPVKAVKEDGVHGHFGFLWGVGQGDLPLE